VGAEAVRQPGGAWSAWRMALGLEAAVQLVDTIQQVAGACTMWGSVCWSGTTVAHRRWVPRGHRWGKARSRPSR